MNSKHHSGIAHTIPIHKLCLAVSTLTMFLALTAFTTNAQCTVRPRPCFFSGTCAGTAEWLIDGSFSENCTSDQGGWVFHPNASRMNDTGFCGLPQNSYARLRNPSAMRQDFQHDGAGHPDFWLGFDIEGGNALDQFGGKLDVWIYNTTDRQWTLVTSFPNTSPISCGHRLYSFYRPDWLGKHLMVYFNTTPYDTVNWRIDSVTFSQRR